jgi:hypothetical protein
LFGLPLSLYAQRYSFKLYSGSQGLGNLATLCMLQDSTGYLWIGTQHGLYRYDGAHFLTFEMRDGLPSARIESLYETPDHVLWAGTSAGLARRAGSRFQYVDVGRPIEIVGRSAIASDQAGRILVSSSAGLLIGNLSTTGYRFVPAPQIPGDDPAVHGIHVSPRAKSGSDAAARFAAWNPIASPPSVKSTASRRIVGTPSSRTKKERSGFEALPACFAARPRPRVSSRPKYRFPTTPTSPRYL